MSSRSGASDATFQAAPAPTAADLMSIIQQGDAVLLTRHAQLTGEWLANHLSSSQIRNIFTTARQIEALWPIKQDDERSESDARRAARQLLLLKPKLAYQTSREQRGGTGMKVLADVLSASIDLVGDRREHFQHFMDFFEAILAYHAAAAKTDLVRR
jgi:CRISPR-associated protein Csm2